MYLREFDRLVSISDLHLGGREGFQIFCQGRRLAAFVDRLTESDTERLALVVNGDIVDFLAEEPAMYFDADGAIPKLERIYEDPAFQPVFQALERFVARPGRTLAVTLGNHDIELALPPVAEWLLHRLSQGEEDRRGRIALALEGAGFSCRVGSEKHGYKHVLCMHGNEVDPFNVVDYGALLQVARALNRDDEVPEWNANGGTRIVIDVMNDIKRRFPFVDLLKPESDAVVPALIALDPGHLGKLGGILKIVRYVARDKVRMRAGWLGGDEEVPADEPSDAEVIQEVLEEQGMTAEPAAAAAGGSGDAVTDLLYQAQTRVDAGDERAPAAGGEEELLGVMGPVKRAFGISTGSDEGDRREMLRRFLAKKLADDETFGLDERDEVFTGLDQAVGRSVDFLITGHTHKARAIDRGAGAWYFNSGTWIRLIKLEPEVVTDEDRFARVWAALGAGTIDALDDVRDLGGERGELVWHRPTAVTVVGDEDAPTYGRLDLVGEDGDVELLARSDP